MYKKVYMRYNNNIVTCNNIGTLGHIIARVHTGSCTMRNSFLMDS